MVARRSLVLSGGRLKELPTSDALDGVTGYVEKATPPTSDDYLRPIIDGDRWFNTSTGITYVYVAGAWTSDAADTVSRYVPFYLQSGEMSQIPLNADGSIPFFLADGTSSPIPTQA